jgi:hypothetical protein
MMAKKRAVESNHYCMHLSADVRAGFSFFGCCVLGCGKGVS